MIPNIHWTCLVLGGIRQVGAYDNCSFHCSRFELATAGLQNHWSLAHAMVSPWQLKSLAARTLTVRALSTSPCTLSKAAPSLFGEDSKGGTDIEKATGLEGLQLLGQLHNVDVFIMGPLLITKPGTLADPALVPAYVRDDFCESHWSLLIL